MMKLTKFNTVGLIALVCGAFYAPTAQAAYTTGDLLLAFRSTTDTSKTFVVNLGAASTYRDSTSTIDVTATRFSGTTLDAGLDAAFGNNWTTDTGLYMGLLGGKTSAGLTGEGTGNVSYVGKKGTGASTDAGYGNMAGGARNGLANLIFGFADNPSGTGSFNTFISNGANAANVSLSGDAAVIDTSNTSDYTDSITTAYYGYLPLGEELNVVTGFGASGNNKLNLYRILGSVSGATDAPSAAGVSQFQGSFSLGNTGSLTFDSGVAAVPEPSRVVLLGLGVCGFFMRRRRAAK